MRDYVWRLAGMHSFPNNILFYGGNLVASNHISIPLRVRTFLAGSDDIESERVIDHGRHSDRLWLGKHCFWAFRNGRDVETEIVED